MVWGAGPPYHILYHILYKSGAPRPDPNGARGPSKKESGRPAWRAGPKWGKIGQSNGKNMKINRKSNKIYGFIYKT